MKKKYVKLRILYMLLGYFSLAIFIFALILIILGKYNGFFMILLIISAFSMIITTTLDYYYQTKIDKIDYDDLR